jgi:hypothetical protein
MFLEKNIIKKGQGRQDRRGVGEPASAKSRLAERRQAGVTAIASAFADQDGEDRLQVIPITPALASSPSQRD